MQHFSDVGASAVVGAWRAALKLLAYLRRGTYTECTLGHAVTLRSIGWLHDRAVLDRE